MTQEKDFDVVTVLSAFLTGGAIGFGLALLLTPYSGKETRAKIKEASDIAKEKALELAAEVKNKSEEILGQSKKLLDEAKNQIQSVAETFKE
ncbi:MAG: YtxH domain-containing protein, partial [Candidatus Desantisbacteria bacterium]